MRLTIIMVVAILLHGCNDQKKSNDKNIDKTDNVIAEGATDAELLDKVQKQTFDYFWEGAEPISGLAGDSLPRNKQPIDTCVFWIFWKMPIVFTGLGHIG